MENQNESLEFDINTQRNKVRPAFILVLCILSWASVGWNVFSSVSDLTRSYDSLEKEAKTAIYEAKKSANGAEELVTQTTDFFMARLETNKSRNYGYLLLYLLQGLAVYMMFQLKRMGYFMYLLVQVGVLVVLSMSYPWPNAITLMGFVYILFTSILFSTLFGVNLKHLK